jgi:hypothetical protein
MNYQPMTCAKCHTAIHIQRRRFLPVTALFLLSAFNVRFYCPTCETRISISADYSRWTPVVIVLATILFAWFTRTPDSRGAWLLSMILASFILRTGFLMVFPPPLAVAPKTQGIPFAVCYVVFALTVFIQQFILFGWAAFLFGTKRELYEHLEMLSYPIAWINPKFLITPQNSFFDVCGVLLANSYFGAFTYWVCANTVRAIFRRSRVTQLSITDSEVDIAD